MTFWGVLIDEGVIVYIDDILIYSETEAEHTVVLQKVLEKLKKANLCVAINKSRFHVKKVEYLGYLISDEWIELSPERSRQFKTGTLPIPMLLQQLNGHRNSWDLQTSIEDS